jgi:hypothetical protein
MHALRKNYGAFVLFCSSRKSLKSNESAVVTARSAYSRTQSSTGIAPPSPTAHETLRTGILYYTVFRCTATLKVAPQIGAILGLESYTYVSIKVHMKAYRFKWGKASSDYYQ